MGEAHREYRERFQRYESLSLRELLDLPDEDVVDALNREAFRRAESFSHRYSQSKASLSRGLFVTSGCLHFDAEVRNGGFFQFFENDVFHAEDPLIPDDLLDCLTEIDAHEHARLLRFASAIVPLIHPCSADPDDDEPTLDWDDPINKHFLAGMYLLDDAFYDLPDLETYLLRYTRTYPERFLDQ